MRDLYATHPHYAQFPEQMLHKSFVNIHYPNREAITVAALSIELEKGAFVTKVWYIAQVEGQQVWLYDQLRFFMQDHAAGP